jgi:hypothetical protein
MASGLYEKYRQAQLDLVGGVAWLTDPIKVVLIDTGAYTVNLNTHQYLSDIPVGARTSISAALTGKTSTNGVARANPAVFPLVTGPQSEAMALFKETGSAATSQLIVYIDVAVGLPITPNGADETVPWDSGPNGIFKL